MKQIKSLSLQSFEHRAVKYCRIKKQRQKKKKKRMYIPGLVGSKSIYPSIGNGSSKNKLPKYGTIVSAFGDIIKSSANGDCAPYQK